MPDRPSGLWIFARYPRVIEIHEPGLHGPKLRDIQDPQNVVSVPKDVPNPAIGQTNPIGNSITAATDSMPANVDR